MAGGCRVKVLMLTREYPPDVYGGAGVHVEYLARELAKLAAVEVRTFGLHDIEAGSLVVQGHGAAAETTDAPGGHVPVRAGGPGPSRLPQPRCPADGRRDRPLPHLVRRVRRAPGPAHPRHPAGRDRALDRAAPAVEARAARPGRGRLGVGRARRARGRGRGHRRLDGDAAATFSATTRSRPSGCTSSRTESTPTPTARCPAGRESSGSGSTRHAPTCSSWAGSPGRRASST